MNTCGRVVTYLGECSAENFYPWAHAHWCFRIRCKVQMPWMPRMRKYHTPVAGRKAGTAAGPSLLKCLAQMRRREQEFLWETWWRLKWSFLSREECFCVQRHQTKLSIIFFLGMVSEAFLEHLYWSWKRYSNVTEGSADQPFPKLHFLGLWQTFWVHING